MYCPRCRHVNPEGAQFCNTCGAGLETTCLACAQVNPPGGRFCNACGRPLAQPPPSPPEPGVVPPQSYTPKHLIETVLTSRSALEGERKQVTVLFADMVESTELSQRVDPEVMHQILDQVLRLMAEAVHRYEGTVNQYLGDGLMALFGAPVALEDHAFRAVQAAVAIQETISGYSAQLQHEHGVEVRLRLGLNTGLVVVGRIGDDLRMDYTAVGYTTHLAARMQTLAAPGTILLTEATHRLVAEYIRSEALEPVAIKGQPEPVKAYRVTGRRRWRSRLEIITERGITRLVGRQRELDLLHECLARAQAGDRQVVGIVGEPGIGKSRLLYEFHNSLEAGRIDWLIGHCVGYGQATPYFPFLEILRRNFHIEEGDNPLQIREKLRQGILRLDPCPNGVLPFLEALFGLPGADDALQPLNPRDKRQKTFEAIRDLAMARSRLRPHVLVYENLHWIDQTSEDCLALLIDSLADTPVLVLTTHRPGYAVRWADKPYYTQIALDLLTEAESAAMVATLLRSRDLPPDLLQFIQEKTEGNPLFVEEVTYALQESGLLVGQNGGIRWTGEAAVEFPATIQDIIRARIDRLEAPVKRTVQIAAVIGRLFTLRLLNRLSGSAVEVQHALETLKHLELIHATPSFPETEYLFKHVVIRDVAYQSLLVQQRQQLHGIIGEAIEDLYPTQREEQATILAHHYAQSVHQDKAITYAFLAGDRAARLHARAEATTYYTQVLTMAQALPDSPEAQRTQIEAILRLATVGMSQQDIERNRQHLQRARTMAEAVHDPLLLARVFHCLGQLHYVLGELPTAINYAQQSLVIADRLGDDALAASPVNLMGRVYYMLSDYVRASQMLARSAEQMHRLGNTSEEATAAGFAGYAFGYLGEFDRAFAATDHGLQLAQKIQNPFAEAAAYFYRGGIHERRGAWAHAISNYEEARRVAERAGDSFRVYTVKIREGRAHALAGNPRRGRMLIEEGMALSEQLGTMFAAAGAKAFLAECHLALGEHQAVPPLCHEAIRLTRETLNKNTYALAHKTLAEALDSLDPANPQPAESAMLEAIRVFREISNKPELARSYASYARLLQGWREEVKAKEYLAQAIGMFQQMGMAWDQTQAEQALHAIP